jgi:hypothetical protein
VPVVDDLRRAAASALVALAASPSYLDRADAGRGLAGFAELAEAEVPLLRLVLDADDTFVTRETAAALLRRHDRVGLALLGRALTDAEDDHVMWIGTAVQDVLGVFAVERDAALREIEAMLRTADGPERAGLTALATEVAGLVPVLRPDVPAVDR